MMKRKLGVYRSQTQQMPMTQPAFSAQPIIRHMSTATKPMMDKTTEAKDVSGYTTVAARAVQGRTPAAGAGGITHSSAGAACTYRRFAPGRRVKLQTPSGGSR